MPCVTCKIDFTVLKWKIRCAECEQYHCSKCLQKFQGVLLCERCFILNQRPPDRAKLMELRVKDLRDYLTKNRVSTRGVVEKAELVDILCIRSIPPRKRRGLTGLSHVLTGSAPNLATQSQEQINNIRYNLNSNLNNIRSYAENALHNIGRKVGPSGAETANNSDSEVEVQASPVESEPPPAPPPAPVDTPTIRYPKLTDFTSVDELNDLSVKQLKELLTLNRVDYKGCVEKSELLDRAIRLWTDSARSLNENLDDDNADNVCKICMDAPLECVILECGHMATCVDCGKRLAECPICRQFVTRVVRTFKV